MISLTISTILVFVLVFYGLDLKYSKSKFIYNIYQESLYKFLLLLVLAFVGKLDFFSSFAFINVISRTVF